MTLHRHPGLPNRVESPEARKMGLSTLLRGHLRCVLRARLDYQLFPSRPTTGCTEGANRLLLRGGRPRTVGWGPSGVIHVLSSSANVYLLGCRSRHETS